MLTDQERLTAITPLYQNKTVARMALDVSIDDYRAIEQAMIQKLAQGVSVEPSYYWEPDGTIEWMKEGSGFSTNTGPAHGWKITHYYTATAIAAARVQDQREIEALRSLLERCRPSVVRDIADIERFLIRKGHANPPDTEWLETTQDVLNRIDALITGQ